MIQAHVFGNNQVGQLGISHPEDYALVPQTISHIEASTIARIALTQNQTFIVLHNGSILSCGENENNELGRSGKRSWLHRIDALETFQIHEASAGSGFVTLVCEDGKIVSWGKNDMGQLCNTTREEKTRPRVNVSINEAVLQVSCGAAHAIALTRSGRVVTWGGNRWGQLGDGQMTSTTKLSFPLQLRHRPVISVTCGENHNLVMTIGGNVFAWGENSHGQLGLGDTTNRLRPEQIKTLKSMGATKIAAGKNHSLVITQVGLLVTFGSNNHGQCGIDSEVKIQPFPMVVERLRELRTVDVTAGAAHSLVMCESRGGDVEGSKVRRRVYVMGLNSSGQLGLGNTTSQSTPVLLPLDPELFPVGIATGPMALHSILITQSMHVSYDVDISPVAYASASQLLSPLRNLSLPSVTFSKVEQAVLAFKQSKSGSLVRLRELISAAYSSIPVLNASFLLPTERLGHGSLCVDLQAVRGAYDMIMSTESIDPHAVATLGRATLHLADQLKECPVDDAENLSIFLIVLENPLMLRASSFHVAIEMVIRGILSVPKTYRLILFKWLKSYPSEYFGRVLQVLQGFLTHILMNKSLNLDPTPVILVLETLHQCNVEEKIVPLSLFYNPTIPKVVSLVKEWIKFRSPQFDSNIFNYCSYPFLIHEYHKLQLIQYDFKTSQELQAAVMQSKLPIGEYIRYRLALMNAVVALFQSSPSTTSSDINEEVDSALRSSFPETQPPLASTELVPPALSLLRSAVNNSQQSSTRDSRSERQSATNTAVLNANRVEELIGRAGQEVLDSLLLPHRNAVILPAGVAVGYEYELSRGSVRDVEISFEIKVSRSRLLPDFVESMDRILATDPNVLMLPLRVTFKGEIGMDYGGIKREFFALVVKELITRSNVLGSCGSGRLLWFTHDTVEETSSPQAKLTRREAGFYMASSSTSGALLADATTACDTKVFVAAHKSLPYYLGLLVGLAVYNGVHVDVPLPHCVYKTIKGEELTLTDLYAVDAELAEGLQSLLSFQEGDGVIEDVFGVNFTASSNPLTDNSIAQEAQSQQSKYVELVSGGSEKYVTRVNRADFVQRFVRHALHGSVVGELGCFIEGLRKFMPDDVVNMCSASELEHILCGSHEIGDLSELRQVTVYKGKFTDESPIIQWFWNHLSSLSLSDKRKFLHFVTGSERVPLGGIQFLKLTIQSIAQPEAALPTSHTCFNILNIPETYSSAEQLSERFKLALQHHEGFGLI